MWIATTTGVINSDYIVALSVTKTKETEIDEATGDVGEEEWAVVAAVVGFEEAVLVVPAKDEVSVYAKLAEITSKLNTVQTLGRLNV